MRACRRALTVAGVLLSACALLPAASVGDTSGAPVASAGGPYTGVVGVPVAVDASASSDANGDPLTFAWDFHNNGLFADATGALASVTFNAPGTYPIAVQVTAHPASGPNISNVASTTVQVSADTPVANAGGPYFGTPGSPITLDGRQSHDPGGLALTYAWDLQGNGLYTDSQSATPTFTIAAIAPVGTIYTVCLKVSNGDKTNTACSTVTVTALKASQSISFAALADKTFGDPDFTVAATASSGLAVSFSATGSCTVTAATVHLTGAGSCTVTASQGGDANYDAAADVAQTFSVVKATQSISFGALADATFGAPDFDVAATASSGLAVSFSATGSCTVTGTTVHLTGAGSCTITASQAGDADYKPAGDVSRTFSVAQLQAITVPASATDPTVRHVTYSGATITLKGVAHGGNQFRWDFGDGSQPTAWTAIGDAYNLGVTHQYSGSVGQDFTAALSVRDSANPNAVASASYPVEIEAGSDTSNPAQLLVRTKMAIDEGLWYLHVHETRSTYAAGAPGYGQPYGVWSTDASFDTRPSSCSAIDALERHGSLPQGDASADPYVEDVQRGLNAVFAKAAVANITGVTKFGGPSPDVNGNGNAVFLGGNSTFPDALCALAVADSKDGTATTATGPANVYGRTYGDLGQDLVDWFAYGQSDCSGYPGYGGWWYSANFGCGAEMGTDVWPILALGGLESKLGETVPPFVRQNVPFFVNVAHHTGLDNDNGGWGYQSGAGPYIDVANTAAGIIAHAFEGDSPQFPAVLAGLGYAYRHWTDQSANTGQVNVGDSFTMYLLSTALNGTFPGDGTRLVTDYDYMHGTQTANSFDWFYTPSGQTKQGYGTYLVSAQAADGSWADAAPGSNLIGADAGFPGTTDAITAFDLAVLEQAPPLPAKTAQSISFAALADQTAGDPDFTVAATASSGLAVSFSATGSCTVTVATVHLTGAGSCTITASQAGDASYDAAADVAQTFTIALPSPPTCVIVAPNEVDTNLGVVLDITLDGSRSFDPGGGTLTYSWTTNGPGSLSNASSALAKDTFGPIYGASNTWNDTLTISNGSLSSSCTKTIEVVDNAPPRFTTVPHDVVFEADENTSANVDAWLANVVAIDPAIDPATGSQQVSVSNDFVPVPGVVGGIGVGNTVQVTWTATNPNGSAAQTSATVSVVDTTPPTLSLPSDITRDATGPTTPVSFTATADDFVSGDVVPTCNPSSGSEFSVGTTTVNCVATDGAGNEAKGSFRVTISDTTPPLLTPTVSGTLGANGWYTGDVKLSWTVTDSESTVISKSGCGDVTVSADTTGTDFTCTATSDGGTNSATATIRRDATPPSIECTVPDQTIWYGSDVSVSCTAGDSGSGLANAGDASFSLSTSVAGGDESSNASTGTRQACDKAGNCATAGPSTFKVDRKPPVAVPTQSPAANGNVWNKSDVTVDWHWSDGGSGVDASSCTSSSTSTGEGLLLTVSASCKDDAGNTGTASYGVAVDKTPPTLTFSGDRSYGLLETVNVTCSAADPLSGVASSSCSAPLASGPAWTFGQGSHVLTATATDNADNLATGSTSFAVAATAGDLCQLTKQFLESSARFQALTPAQKAAADGLAGNACRFLAQIVPKLTPTQKAKLISLYKQAVSALAPLGWLTQSQANTLKTLADGL